MHTPLIDLTCYKCPSLPLGNSIHLDAIVTVVTPRRYAEG